VRTFAWNAGNAPPQAELKKALYEQRKAYKVLPDLVLKPKQPSDFALSLPHLYYYVIPLALAECYQALGDYPAAETQFFLAAAYQSLSAAVRAPYVWSRLATLYLEWGNSLYVDEEGNDALGIYQRVLTLDGTAPGSRLYTTESLKPGADAARGVINNLA